MKFYFILLAVLFLSLNAVTAQTLLTCTNSQSGAKVTFVEQTGQDITLLVDWDEGSTFSGNNLVITNGTCQSCPNIGGIGRPHGIFKYYTIHQTDPDQPVTIDWAPPGTYVYCGGGNPATITGLNDADNDGVNDADDNCPDTPSGEGVNAEGCSCSQVSVDDGDPCTLDECVDGVVTHTPNPDSDGDGVCDEIDNCINTANADQADGDGDGIGDACDACPNIPDPNCATCGNGKYLVCHIPPGQPENAQQLCISLNAANNHIGNHGGCYWGYCNSGIMVNQSNPLIKSASHPQGNYDRTEGNNPLVETEKGNVYFFEVSPNPATDKINLHLHGHSDGAQLYIHDQLGRKVWMQQLEESQSSLQLNLDLENGLYVVSLISNGETISKLLVINK
ncbi:MAG: T9SS type A sorting domain-containing protein [Lewinellaceae bacterium]|nr:T9SS type A sorting domain-containing protein [Saprospiraceae bacterium]MCB9342862.1 T9SS type A sorting domain-containing protein [Lewinellaceae bacterium]